MCGVVGLSGHVRVCVRPVSQCVCLCWPHPAGVCKTCLLWGTRGGMVDECVCRVYGIGCILLTYMQVLF